MSTAALHQEAVEIAIEGVGVAIKRSSMPMGFGELTRTQLIKGCTQTFAPGTLSVRVANKSQKPNTKRPPLPGCDCALSCRTSFFAQCRPSWAEVEAVRKPSHL